MERWPEVYRAAEAMVALQAEFVAWWDECVTPRLGQNRFTVEVAATATSMIPAARAQKDTGIHKSQVSRWRGFLQDKAAYVEQLAKAARSAAMAKAKNSELVQQSDSNEHYTPAQYIDAARAVLGEIDLDPASCRAANKIVRATKFYTIEDHGEQKPWRGRVWLNPPYGGFGAQFIGKLCKHFDDGTVTAAIALVNAHCTDTSWFQLLWNGTLCFTDHRINFEGDDQRSGSTHGSVFVYFGKARQKFAAQFSEFGPIVARIK